MTKLNIYKRNMGIEIYYLYFMHQLNQRFIKVQFLLCLQKKYFLFNCAMCMLYFIQYHVQYISYKSRKRSISVLGGKLRWIEKSTKFVEKNPWKIKTFSFLPLGGCRKHVIVSFYTKFILDPKGDFLCMSTYINIKKYMLELEIFEWYKLVD